MSYIQNSNYLQQIFIFLVSTLLLHLFYLPVLGQDTDICLDAGFELSTATIDADCYGASNGSATVASTGCTCVFSGCTFLWSDGQGFHTAENLTAGIYTVTVTHPNGCVLDTVVVIGEPDKFVDVVVSTPASCENGNDGTAKVIPTNNSGPLTYEWSTGSTAASVSNLPTGLHTVIVTNFLNCSTIETVYVEAEESATLEVITTPSCADVALGTATVSVTGGTPPYTYTWDMDKVINQPTIENLAVGNHSLMVTDANGCVYDYTDQIKVEEINVETAVLASSLVVCPNSPIELEAFGGATYTWLTTTGLSNPTIANPIATIEETTTFEVLIETALGCSEVASITIETLPIPIPTVSAWNTKINQGESTQLIAVETSGASFSWSPAEGLSNTSSNAPVASPTETTTYTVTTTGLNGCTASASITIEIEEDSISTGVNNNEKPLIRVYPNPATDWLAVQLPLKDRQTVQVNMYNTTGQIVQHQVYQNQVGLLSTQLQVNQLPKGLYYVELMVNDERLLEKVIIQ